MDHTDWQSASVEAKLEWLRDQVDEAVEKANKALHLSEQNSRSIHDIAAVVNQLRSALTQRGT